MSPRGRALVLAALLGAACSGTGEGGDDPSGGWIPLFNGRDLDGWRVKITGHELDDNAFHTFRVEDGILRVVYDDYRAFDGAFGHLFYETPYSRYRLRLEYRFVGEQMPGGPGWAFRNSGVMFHSQSPESMRVDQEFPVSVEAQLLGGNGTDERPTGNVCTPGTHVVIGGEVVERHCTDSSSPTYHGDRWVAFELEVHGDGRIVHRVEGEVVLEYEHPQYDLGDADARRLTAGEARPLDRGYIALQAESHPVEFRRIELLPLE